jgi:hypothetical protein
MLAHTFVDLCLAVLLRLGCHSQIGTPVRRTIFIISLSVLMGAVRSPLAGPHFPNPSLVYRSVFALEKS